MNVASNDNLMLINSYLGFLLFSMTAFLQLGVYKMTEKFCVYCQEVTPHYMNQYGCFECCNCEPLSESDYESDSSHDTCVPDSSDSA